MAAMEIHISLKIFSAAISAMRISTLSEVEIDAISPFPAIVRRDVGPPYGKRLKPASMSRLFMAVFSGKTAHFLTKEHRKSLWSRPAAFGNSSFVERSGIEHWTHSRPPTQRT